MPPLNKCVDLCVYFVAGVKRGEGEASMMRLMSTAVRSYEREKLQVGLSQADFALDDDNANEVQVGQSLQLGNKHDSTS